MQTNLTKLSDWLDMPHLVEGALERKPTTNTVINARVALSEYFEKQITLDEVRLLFDKLGL